MDNRKRDYSPRRPAQLASAAHRNYSPTARETPGPEARQSSRPYAHNNPNQRFDQRGRSLEQPYRPQASARLASEQAPDRRRHQGGQVPLGVNERRRGSGSAYPARADRAMQSTGRHDHDAMRGARSSRRHDGISVRDAQGSGRRSPGTARATRGVEQRGQRATSRPQGTGCSPRPSNLGPRTIGNLSSGNNRYALGRPRHRNSYTHVRSNRIFTRSGWLERLMRTPVIVIVLAIALLGGGGFAIHFANQQRAAEEAAQAEAVAEKKRLAAQKVNPLRLGIGAYPVSTPRSEWKQGTMPHLYQTDPAWAQLPYAGGTVENNACGPTSLTMVYVYLTGRTDLDPGDMAAFADQNNFAPTGATEWSFMTTGASMLGLNSTALPITRNAITQALANGSPVICSVLPGDFTAVGHYIVLKSIDDRGMVEVFDPNSPYNSARRWDIQRILTQTRNCWSFWV